MHWHGLVLPNAMDGAGEITQDPIAPGETFTYEFGTEQRGDLSTTPTITSTGSKPWSLRRAHHRSARAC